MIQKSEIADMFSDYAVLLVNQVNKYSKSEIVDFLESISKCPELEVPDVVLGDDMKTLFFKHKITGQFEMITAESVKKYMDYFEFTRTGNINY